VDFPICIHLAEYRDCLDEAESAYAEVVAGVDRYRQGREIAATKAALAVAVERWLQTCGKLRALLVRLVAEGAVVLPRRKAGLPRCARCRCAIHRLEFPEWNLREDGAVQFRDADIAPGRAAGPAAVPAGR